jgi:hypothetical protein
VITVALVSMPVSAGLVLAVADEVAVDAALAAV